jgi:hypothetical protein
LVTLLPLVFSSTVPPASFHLSSSVVVTMDKLRIMSLL